MKKYLLGAAAGFAGVAATIVPGAAATLDEVMARLDSLQRDNQTLHRDNQNLHRDNQAMQKEIAALRQKEQRSTPVQALAPRNAPSRALAPAASSAMAASLPVKGPYVEPPRAFSWSGFYMGVHGGYGWGSTDWTSLSDAFAENSRSKGFLGGFQGGANYQFGNWVAGIEADFSLIDANATGTDLILPFTATARSQIDWLATFTGRFGYAFDRSLLYVKGGLAGAEFKDNLSFSAVPVPGVLLFTDSGAQSNTRIGWTAGAGFEYAVFNNWTANIEYDYLDFGTKDQTFVVDLTTFGPSGSTPLNQSIKRKLQLVKVGINYKFGDDSR